MKLLAALFLACMVTACNRSISITTPEGMDVYVVGNNLAVVDSNNNYTNYKIKKAYKRYNQRADLYRMLQEGREEEVVSRNNDQ